MTQFSSPLRNVYNHNLSTSTAQVFHINTISDSGGNTIVCKPNLTSVIAHRGASADAPENTLAAMQLAADQGARCVEIDVSISRDDVPFVHHDDELQRCTDGQGLLCDRSAEELDNLDASKLMPQYQPQALPRLSAVLSLLKKKGLGLNLEIKPRKGLEERTVAAICQVIQGNWPQELPLVFSSFNQKALLLAQQKAPTIARAILFGELPDDWHARAISHDVVNVHLDAGRLHAQQVQEIKQAGYALYTYTVNDAGLASRLFEWGVDGIFTDCPGLIIQSTRR